MTTAKLQKLNKNGEEVLEVCDAANNVGRLTRDFNDVKKKFTDISSIININFFHLLRNLIHLLFDNYYVNSKDTLLAV